MVLLCHWLIFNPATIDYEVQRLQTVGYVYNYKLLFTPILEALITRRYQGCGLFALLFYFRILSLMPPLIIFDPHRITLLLLRRFR